MIKKLFGTDGIRSLSNDEIFNDFSLNTLSQSIIKNNKNLKIVVGRDTRESSKRIENKLANALKNNGAKVLKVGLITTPAISYLTKKLNCNVGIVVSASHNPYQFNGIKFFNKKGEKLSDSDENKIEKSFFDSKKVKEYRNNGLPYIQFLKCKNFALNNFIPEFVQMLKNKHESGFNYINPIKLLFENCLYPNFYLSPFYYIYKKIKLLIRRKMIIAKKSNLGFLKNLCS